jgi:hypothetical protein
MPSGQFDNPKHPSHYSFSSSFSLFSTHANNAVTASLKGAHPEHCHDRSPQALADSDTPFSITPTSTHTAAVHQSQYLPVRIHPLGASAVDQQHGLSAVQNYRLRPRLPRSSESTALDNIFCSLASAFPLVPLPVFRPEHHSRQFLPVKPVACDHPTCFLVIRHRMLLPCEFLSSAPCRLY